MENGLVSSPSLIFQSVKHCDVIREWCWSVWRAACFLTPQSQRQTWSLFKWCLRLRLKFNFKTRTCTTIHCLNSKQGQQAVWCYKNAGKMRSKSDSTHMSSAWTNCSMSRQSRRFRHFIAHSCPTSEMSTELILKCMENCELADLRQNYLPSWKYFCYTSLLWPKRYLLSCDNPLQNLDWQLYWKPWVWSY